eukprot:Nk52_evm12s322 gene=Nk52_evmTU12s322
MVTLEYLSAGCNRVPHALDWAPRNGLIAFGAHSNVLVYDPLGERKKKKNRKNPSGEGEEESACGSVLCSLRGHKSRVNCVIWIPKGMSAYSGKKEEREKAFMEEDLIASGSSDGEIRLWRQNQECVWDNIAVLKGHKGSVTCLSRVVVGDVITLFSTSSDGTVRVWRRSDDSTGELDEEEWSCVQVMDYGNNYQQIIAASLLPGTEVVLLATGGVDKRIHIYAAVNNSGDGVEKSGRGVVFEKSVVLQGHADWISGLAFALWEDKLLLASSAQDYYVRLWNFQSVAKMQEQERREEERQRGCSGGRTNDDGDAAEEDSLRLMNTTAQLKKYNLKHIFAEDGKPIDYCVRLEAVLEGHDDWVYGLSWAPNYRCAAKEGEEWTVYQAERLLTSSMDKTMMIWEPDRETGVWVNFVTVGDIGGNTLGLFGGCFGPRGKSLIGHGYQGAMHLWQEEGDEDELANGVGNLQMEQRPRRAKKWTPCLSVSGHFGSVSDISWDPTGSYLISTSVDQTSRLHAQWRDDKAKAGGAGDGSWHEIGRPQIHGHDIFCVDFVTSTKFASGAEEKVIRTFESTRQFLESAKNICKVDISGENLPLGASVPALGLSNKAVFSEADKGGDMASDPYGSENLACNSFAGEVIEEPPLEEYLLQNTLWPETQKLYGHGYEMVCVTGSHDGKLLASACRATNAEHGVVRLWDMETFQEIAALESHTLTVTQLAFSHTDEWLVAVSRDRHWSVFRRDMDESLKGKVTYRLHSKCKAHERILWSVSWSHDDTFFVTCSRDKKIKVWAQKGEGDSNVDNPWMLLSELPKQPESVTAVDMAQRLVCINDEECYVLAVGLENGSISLFRSASATKGESMSFELWKQLDTGMCHSETVRRLQWRPVHKDSDSKELLLASCGNDHSVRLFRVE